MITLSLIKRLVQTNERVIFLVVILLFSSFSLHSDDTAVYQTDPIDLVSPKRADLMAKYIYAKHREWGTNSLFGLHVYYRHLQVWNGFSEGDPPKTCFDDFRLAFDQLLDSVKYSGFNPAFAIPLGYANVISNGAHRLVSCLLYNRRIYTKKSSIDYDFGFSFFKKQGLESKCLDAMALQYCELKPDSYILVVFPSAKGRNEEIEAILNHYLQIVYKKEITFTEKGGVNFVLTAYENEPFIFNGIHILYEAAQQKALRCFPKNQLKKNRARVYLLQSSHLEAVQHCKEEIRGLFNIYHDSVHTTDTHQEAIILARALFNNNSIDCLNNRDIIPTPNFDRYFENYRNALALGTKPTEWFCLDSGAVLAAYGLRDCNDLDYLSFKNETLELNMPGIDNHSDQLKYHTVSLDNILFDPDNHFFYKGIKFCSLKSIKEMKKIRGQKKDKDDVKLINEKKKKIRID